MIRHGNLLHELDNLVLSGVARQELVDVSHEVDADGASQGILILWKMG